MRRTLFRAVAAGFCSLTLSALLGAAAPDAGAVGVKIYNTDDNGQETSTVTNFGNTGPSARCVWHGDGEINLGFRVCYL